MKKIIIRGTKERSHLWIANCPYCKALFATDGATAVWSKKSACYYDDCPDCGKSVRLNPKKDWFADK